MSILESPSIGDSIHGANTHVEGVADCVFFPKEQSIFARAASFSIAAAAGIAGGYFAAQVMPEQDVAWRMLAGLAFLGGLLSTWSPCGYSSLCLLRPAGRYSANTVMRWLPTFIMHGLGYALGALVLGTILGLGGHLLGFSGYTTISTIGLAAAAILYGAHQLGFIRVPYPQRKAQVPHDARQRFPMWVIGGIYGVALGLNYLTYVQTPILYLVTAVAMLSGDVMAAIGVFALFNLGRFLPMSVNLLPVTDIGVQGWLARRQEQAATLDGALLVAAGCVLLTLAALSEQLRTIVGIH